MPVRPKQLTLYWEHHANLLETVSLGIKAFWDDYAGNGHGERRADHELQ